jgi:hypothetical protein
MQRDNLSQLLEDFKEINNKIAARKDELKNVNPNVKYNDPIYIQLTQQAVKLGEKIIQQYNEKLNAFDAMAIKKSVLLKAAAERRGEAGGVAWEVDKYKEIEEAKNKVFLQIKSMTTLAGNEQSQIYENKAQPSTSENQGINKNMQASSTNKTITEALLGNRKIIFPDEDNQEQNNKNKNQTLHSKVIHQPKEAQQPKQAQQPKETLQPKQAQQFKEVPQSKETQQPKIPERPSTSAPQAIPKPSRSQVIDPPSTQASSQPTTSQPTPPPRPSKIAPTISPDKNGEEENQAQIKYRK